MASGDYNDAANQLGQVAEALHEITDAQLEELGQFALSLIITRTTTGLDADGAAFAPYSPSYKAAKDAAGHSGSLVNLTRKGHMMQAMTTERGDGEVSIVFASPLEATKAAAHDGGTKAKATRAAKRAASAERKKQKKWYRRAWRALRGQKAGRIMAARRQHLPERNFFDIRSDRDLLAVADVMGDAVVSNVSKAFVR